MKKRVVIVGAGISGLTAAAYLAKEYHDVLLIEKSPQLGGLMGGFVKDGFTFDSGIRGLENAGTLFPLLKQLGITIDFLPNPVDMGIEDTFIRVDPTNNFLAYRELLLSKFPNETSAITAIFKDIKKISKYMKVLYDVDNPLFLDPKKDQKYLLTKILPWMVQYTFTIGKIEKLKAPIQTYLKNYTNNQELIAAITQHFFTDTPTFFALSYLKMHSDYFYPKGGIQTVVSAFQNYIEQHGGKILTQTEITKIDVKQKIAYSKGNHYAYDALLWCGDLNFLYKSVENTPVSYQDIQTRLAQATGNDSLYQLYVSVDLPSDFFKKTCAGHLVYLPKKAGLSALTMTVSELLAHLPTISKEKQRDVLQAWLTDFAMLTTYEVAIPNLRDATLAPKNQTGVILSTMFPYSLAKWIQLHHDFTWFKQFFSEAILLALNQTLWPNWKSSILSYLEATPLTIESRFNNTQGAITGWSFTGDIPVEQRMFRIARSILTPFDGIFQSSHWTFSPSGFPTSIVTAKLAANKIHKLKMK